MILHKKDSKNRIVEIYSNRKDIEKAIMEYNIQLYQQVHETKVYQDKIYSQLQEGLIRDKILIGELRRLEYDSQNVFKFLKLLKQPEYI